MDSYDDVSDDELTSYIIQLSIQESCQDAFLKSEVSLETATDENVRVLAAIEQGQVSVLREMLRHAPAFRELDSRGWLPLHRAAAQPTQGVLQTVLRAAPPLALEERTAREGETPLTLAAKAGLVDNVKSLLEHGASPHNANRKNQSPLLLAVRARSYEMTYTLIARGAWVEQVCVKRWTAVHEAARAGSTEILMLLLRHGSRCSQRDVYGNTPLAVAAECAHLHVIDILLESGAQVNAQALNGESVLMDAAGSGNTACIQLLLQNGANPNLASLSGHLPIHKAAFQGHYDALNILIPLTTKKALKLAGQSPVHSAAEGGHSRCLELLIENGYSVNAPLNTRNSDNYTDLRKSALYFAVSNGDVSCAEILLNAGAEPNLDPLRCLLVAVRAGWYKMVQMLLDKRADVNCFFRVVSDTAFPTALQYCLRDETMMRLLLNHGYDAETCFCCSHDDERLAGGGERLEGIPFCEFMSLCCLVHLAGRAVWILLDYVSHVPLCSKFRRILEKQPEWTDICDILGSPRPLKHLCRLEIRRRMTLRKLNDHRIMNSGLFPPRLKNFILYKELDMYGQSAELLM